MQLTHQQATQQTMSAQMLRSMKILQMSAQELRGYLEELTLENPVLETVEYEPSGTDEGERELFDRLEWAASTDRQNAEYYSSDRDKGDILANMGCYLDEEASLPHELRSQFEGLQLDAALLDAIRFLIGRLDANGWLETDIEEQAAQAGVPEALFARALTELQAADPAGVGARSLSECLSLQLGRLAGDHRLAERIAADYLPELARGRIARIAKETGATDAEVRAACALIRRLDPHPGAAFPPQERPLYLTPDVRLIDHGGEFEAVSNREVLPSLRLSPCYLRLMRETGDRETRDYLLKKVNQAKWVLHSIEQRQATILRCVECVAERQAGFLRSRERSLRPMTMQEVAARLGVHESTVSRAIREKYLQTPNGLYPLAFFFSRAVGQGESSLDGAKKLLKALIEEEGEPLSDQRLSEEMGRRGCEISRRTVTKYRIALGIPSAQVRKTQA